MAYQRALRCCLCLVLLVVAIDLAPVATAEEGRTSGDEIEWRFRAGDFNGAEAATFDDSSWDIVHRGHKWRCRGFAWFRAQVTVPQSIDGKPTTGQPVCLRWNAGDGGEVYVRGELQSRYDNDHPPLILLSEKATPGENVPVAVRVFMGPGDDSEADSQLSECALVIESRNRIQHPLSIVVDGSKSQGKLPKIFAGLSQGGGMPDYDPATAAKFREIGIKWFRMDNVLTNVVKRKDDGSLYYDWEDFDRRVDFIRSIGAEPILCLSYMPQPLDAIDNPDRHSRPKDWKQWEDLVYAAVRRCNVERRTPVKYWEVWNESNAGWIVPLPGEDLLQTYLQLYDACARGVKRADPNALVGGPCNAAGPWNSDKGSAFIRGEDFMRGLMKHCEETGMPLDFISWHEYFQPWTVIKDEAETTRRYLDDYPKVKKQVKEFMITEWNFAWWHDRSHDHELGAAWCAASVVRAMIPGGVNKPCFFLAKDSGTELRGNWGMLTGDNKPKPVANVCRMFNMMAPRKLAFLGSDDEITGLASKDPASGRITVLILNFAERYGVRRDVDVTVSNLPTVLRGGECKVYVVDKSHSNIFADRNNCELAVANTIAIPDQKTFTARLRLESNSVALLDLVPGKQAH